MLNLNTNTAVADNQVQSIADVSTETVLIPNKKEDRTAFADVRTNFIKFAVELTKERLRAKKSRTENDLKYVILESTILEDKDKYDEKYRGYRTYEYKLNEEEYNLLSKLWNIVVFEAKMDIYVESRFKEADKVLETSKAGAEEVMKRFRNKEISHYEACEQVSAYSELYTKDKSSFSDYLIWTYHGSVGVGVKARDVERAQLSNDKIDEVLSLVKFNNIEKIIPKSDVEYNRARNAVLDNFCKCIPLLIKNQNIFHYSIFNSY